jgi:hypothetical protein
MKKKGEKKKRKKKCTPNPPPNSHAHIRVEASCVCGESILAVRLALAAVNDLAVRARHLLQQKPKEHTLAANNTPARLHQHATTQH